MTDLIDTPDIVNTSDIVRSGSYDPVTTTAGGFNAECARLEAQAELTFQAELPVLLALGAGGRFLEIGAGSGAVTSRLRVAFPAANLYAVDINPGLLQRCNAADVRLVADASHLPYQEGYFDTVLLRYVLQHLNDPAAVLAEALRVLKPGGGSSSPMSMTNSGGWPSHSFRNWRQFTGSWQWPRRGGGRSHDCQKPDPDAPHRRLRRGRHDDVLDDQ